MNPDDEDIPELFGPMFDEIITLEVRESHLASVSLKIKAADLYYGKTGKFMPLTVWPACDSFLGYFVPMVFPTLSASFSSFKLPDLRGKVGDPSHVHLLELGAGTGKLAIAVKALQNDLAKRAPSDGDLHFDRIVTSDCRSSSIDLIKENIQLNEATLGQPHEIEVLNLQWSDKEADLAPALKGSFNLVVATDVVFAKEAINLLVSTIKYCLKPGGLCLLANHSIRIDNLEDHLFAVCEQKAMAISLLGCCDAEDKVKVHLITHKAD